MKLTMTQAEAEKILLEWAQNKFPDQFNIVEFDSYSYSKTFTFSKEEIIGLIPAQAFIDYDRAKEVLEKVSQATLSSVKEQIGGMK